MIPKIPVSATMFAVSKPITSIFGFQMESKSQLDDANLEAQRAGNTTKICQDHSMFLNIKDSCMDCLKNEMLALY